MKVKVTEEGLLIPLELLEGLGGAEGTLGLGAVEVRGEPGRLVVLPGKLASELADEPASASPGKERGKAAEVGGLEIRGLEVHGPEDPILGLGSNPVSDDALVDASKDAPILLLGEDPVDDPEITDASVNLDRYLDGVRWQGAADGGAARVRELPVLDGIVSTFRGCLPALAERYGVVSLGIFGSYARGEQHEGSDLDVLVGFNEAPDLFVFMDLEEYLGQLAGIEVELVSEGALEGEPGRRIPNEVVRV